MHTLPISQKTFPLLQSILRPLQPAHLPSQSRNFHAWKGLPLVFLKLSYANLSRVSAAPTPLHQGSCTNAWGLSLFLTLAHPAPSPSAKGLWLGPERGMDPSGLQSHPLPASRQGPLSIQVPLDPSGRVNCLRAERELQRGKHPGLREITPHTPPPTPTTRLTVGTDWMLRHLQFGHQAPPPLPAAVPADRLPSVSTTWLSGRAPQPGQRSPCNGWL